MVRGATKQILGEAKRSLMDALCVLQQTVKETRIVFGGGVCRDVGGGEGGKVWEVVEVEVLEMVEVGGWYIN